ncbi:hypothetical protein D9758_017135 [Tetrapyrgos nigripes]|uniref:Uncharacterized protein n=1 Tax=Tetrapyrgos nigripes TaxID=182062 RepID=A0A8H5BIF5_9AGAR|nr:hypothetical protein D9758_017135 [Tetrapyrgos nigripes]
MPPSFSGPLPESALSSTPEAGPEPFVTVPDEFGLYRIYDHSPPTYDPDENTSLDTVTDARTFQKTHSNYKSPFHTASNAAKTSESAASSSESPLLFENISVSRLMWWYYEEKEKSLDNLNLLVQKIILSPEFKQDHFAGFDAHREGRTLDEEIRRRQELPFKARDGWINSSVHIKVAKPGKPSSDTDDPTEESASTVEIQNVWHRDINEVVKAAFQEKSSLDFHMKPFKYMWKPSPQEPEQRVYGEVFWSDRMIEFDHTLPTIEGCALEKVAVGVQLWSDGTHLTQFGTHKLTPIYLYIGNLSKYIRTRPSSYSAHHIAYIPSPFFPKLVVRLCNDVSEARKFAARNFEDLLQLAQPAFEDLLDKSEQNKIVQDLLFDLMTFHAHAKLRVQTDSTIDTFQLAVQSLGQSLRKFAKNTCRFYSTTKELPREAEARLRQKAKKQAKKEARSGKAATSTATEEQPSIKGKKFSMKTYKTHAPSHYPEHAKIFGTYDSTATLNLDEHTMSESQRLLYMESSDDILTNDPSHPYNLSGSQRNWTTVVQLGHVGVKDPAFKDFGQKLRTHVLEHLVLPKGTALTEADFLSLVIMNGRVFQHREIRINYTTYDCRRDQDSVNPRQHADVMMLSDNTEVDDHPYIYARVIGIFHVQVKYHGPSCTTTDCSSNWLRMDLLFVRWFQRDMKYKCGWKAKRLPRLQFLPSCNPDAFGFVDPKLVIRGCYLMPGFAHGQTTGYLEYPGSAGRVPRLEQGQEIGDKEDWKYYYCCGQGYTSHLEQEALSTNRPPGGGKGKEKAHNDSGDVNMMDINNEGSGGDGKDLDISDHSDSEDSDTDMDRHLSSDSEISSTDDDSDVVAEPESSEDELDVRSDLGFSDSEEYEEN